VTPNIERRFSVAISVERVWSAMTDPKELNEWYFPFHVDDEGRAHSEIDGNDRASEVVELETGRMFRTRTKDTGSEGWPPLPASVREMSVVLEATDSGTTITITHSGFGEGIDWQQALEATKRGVDETIADLVLYLETGVGVKRHPHYSDAFHGIGAIEVPAGLQVLSVQPGTFADRLGLRAGDLLVELDGAGVFGFHELLFFRRLHRVGDIGTAAWVRGGKLLRGSAELGPRLPVGAGAESSA